jgi:hypothetical protein
MNRLIVPALCLVLFGAVGCGGGDTGTASEPGNSEPGNSEPGNSQAKDPAPEPAPGGGGGAGGDKVPSCPLNAQTATLLLGQPMEDQGNCLFGDGVASLTITMASQSTGAAMFDSARAYAEKRYGAGKVKDGDMADQAYLAAKDIEAEAHVVSDKGTFTVTLSSFERFGDKPAAYEQTLRRILAAILA